MAKRALQVMLAMVCLALLAGCALLSGTRDNGETIDQAAPAESGQLEAQSLTGAPVLPLVRQGDVWLVPPRGGEPVRVTGSGRAWYPTLSPDGHTLVYVQAPDSEAAEAELYAIDLETGDTRLLIGGVAPFGPPAWSPDGTLLAWPAGEQLLILSPVDGTLRERLPQALPEMSRPEPVWSAGGDTLYYPRAEEGDLAIWSFSLEGEPAPVHALDLHLAWVLAQDPSGGVTLWQGGLLQALDSPQGGGPVSVPEAIGDPVGLAWSLDGSQLALLDDAGAVWIAARGSWPHEPIYRATGIVALRWAGADSLVMRQAYPGTGDHTLLKLDLATGEATPLVRALFVAGPLSVEPADLPALAGSVGAQSAARSYDWYRYQGEWDSGPMASSNCGPTSVAMAIQFARDNLWVPISEIRAYIGGSSWTYASSLRSALDHWGVGNRTLHSMAEVDAALARGSIILAHVWMYHLSPGADYMQAFTSSAANMDRYHKYDQSHWLVLKGTSSDGRYVIVHDPNVWDGSGVYWYSGNTAKGRDRLYRYQEMAAAIASYQYELIEVPDAAAPPPPTVAPQPTRTPLAGAGVWHTVRAGENLYRISLRYGTTVDAIATANGLADPNRIYVGQQLWIPLAGGTPVPTRTPIPTTQVTTVPRTATPTLVPPAPTAPPTAAPPTSVPTPTRPLTPTPAPGAGVWYTVSWGDTLGGIAARHGVTVQAIMQANGLTDPNLVRLGQRLWIPTGGGGPAATPTRAATSTTVPGAERWHVVVRGETLSTIAARYGTTWQAIAGANGLYSWSIIYPGQRLRIP